LPEYFEHMPDRGKFTANDVEKHEKIYDNFEVKHDLFLTASAYAASSKL